MLFRDERWPDGSPCWVDLMVPDRTKAIDFYSALLGWEVRLSGPETGNYGMALVNGRPVAGIGETPPGQPMPPAWTTYLSVSDVDKAVAAVTESGGSIIAPVMDVASEGRMAVAADPVGALFGLWQPVDHLGFEVTSAPGTCAWNEQMSHDFARAKQFYGEVFDFSFGDLSGEGFTYATLDLDGRPAGGMGEFPADVPADAPAVWTTYFYVTDADASAARATELGGKITRPPGDSPYGRVAEILDDQGALLRLMAPTEQSARPEGWDA